MTQFEIFKLSVIFIVGTMLGSFLNVCIYRIPREDSIIWPRSHCVRCGSTLRILDLFPILSYIFLRGRCRYCGVFVSPIYPFVEILTGTLLVLSTIYFPFPLLFIKNTSMLLLSIIIAFIDINYQIIPDKLSIFGIVLGLSFNFISDIINLSQIKTLSNSAFFSGLLAAGCGMLILHIISKIGYLLFKRPAMGGGDVKLAGMIGAFLGLKAILVSLIIAFLLGAIVGVLLILTKLTKKSQYIPFGPYLVLGAGIISFLGVDKILFFYRNLFIQTGLQ